MRTQFLCFIMATSISANVLSDDMSTLLTSRDFNLIDGKISLRSDSAANYNFEKHPKWFTFQTKEKIFTISGNNEHGDIIEKKNWGTTVKPADGIIKERFSMRMIKLTSSKKLKSLTDCSGIEKPVDKKENEKNTFDEKSCFTITKETCEKLEDILSGKKHGVKLEQCSAVLKDLDHLRSTSDYQETQLDNLKSMDQSLRSDKALVGKSPRDIQFNYKRITNGALGTFQESMMDFTVFNQMCKSYTDFFLEEETTNSNSEDGKTLPK